MGKTKRKMMKLLDKSSNCCLISTIVVEIAGIVCLLIFLWSDEHNSNLNYLFCLGINLLTWYQYLYSYNIYIFVWKIYRVKVFLLPQWNNLYFENIEIVNLLKKYKDLIYLLILLDLCLD